MIKTLVDTFISTFLGFSAGLVIYKLSGDLNISLFSGGGYFMAVLFFLKDDK